MARDRRALPLQVRDGLRQFVMEQRLKPGDQLPAEDELSDQFEVSRSTLREALRLLEQDGVLEVRRGSGRYISALPVVERPITRLEGITELLDGMGYRITDQVLSFSVGPPTPEEMSALGLSSTDDVIHLERLRTQDGEPLTYQKDVLPRALFPGPTSGYDWSRPLHLMLDELGQRPTAANTQIRAVTVPRHVAKATGFPANAPCILLVQTIVSKSQVFLIYAHDYLRGDYFSFDVRRSRD